MNEKTTLEGLIKLTDVFFNKRSIIPDSSVTIAELVKRGISHVRYGGKIYRIEVKEMEVEK